jgi:hypothetical protein
MSEQRPVRNIHYEGRDLRERLTALVESWQSTGPRQQSTRDLLTDIIGVLGECDPDDTTPVPPATTAAGAAWCGLTFGHDWHGFLDGDGRTRVCDGTPEEDR